MKHDFGLNYHLIIFLEFSSDFLLLDIKFVYLEYFQHHQFCVNAKDHRNEIQYKCLSLHLNNNGGQRACKKNTLFEIEVVLQWQKINKYSNEKFLMFHVFIMV